MSAAPITQGRCLLYRESFLVLVIGACCLISNLLTGSRSPTVWIDEVMFVDPAANLASGKGLTSTAWYAPKESLWGAVPPLYQFILAGWFQVVGFSLAAVRSVNHLFGILGALALWDFTRRTRVLPHANGRVMLFLLLQCGYGMTFTYRSGRVDGFLFLLAAVAVWCCSLEGSWRRRALLFLCCTMLPWAGLQVTAYVALLAGAVLLVLGTRAWEHVLVAGAGCVVGGLTLVFTYKHLGIWDDLRQLTQAHMGQIFIGSVGFKEPSYLLLLGATGLIGLSDFRSACGDKRRWFLFSALAGVGVPVGIAILGHYPTYYSWMGYAPLAVATSALISGAGPTLSGVPRILALAAIAGSCAIGLPSRVALTALQWHERDYSPVEALVQRTVTPADWVYTDFPAYYAVKPLAELLFLPPYRATMDDEEKRHVTCLVIRPEDFREVSQFLGGKWADTGEAVAPVPGQRSFGAAKYNMRVWRRVESGALSSGLLQSLSLPRDPNSIPCTN